MYGKKRLVITALLAALLFFATALAADAAVGSKQAKLDYNNYKIMVDSKLINLVDKEPFAINGTIYLPLRVVGEALNCSVMWQSEAKTVAITSVAPMEINNLKQQISSKDKEIADLKKQVADLQKQLADADKGGNLADLEEDLLDDYDEIGDVPVDDIIVDGDEDEVEVTVEVDLRRYDDEWADLRDRDIESWVKGLVQEIQRELSKNTEVVGEIVNSYNDDVLVKFSKDGTRSLSLQYRDSKYRGSGTGIQDVVDDLRYTNYDVGGIDFYISSISYKESTDVITVYMKAEDDDASDSWDDLSRNTIENDVEDICEEIAETFEDEAGADPETVYIYFYDEEGDLLADYEYDVADGDLN